MQERDGEGEASATCMSVVVAVLAYEASSTISDVLARIESALPGMPGLRICVQVADDCSLDPTVERARSWAKSSAALEVEVVRNAQNLGYGGNQKSVLRSAVARGHDLLVVMHGDGQHDPAEISDLVGPLRAGDVDAVFGARTVVPGAARNGGMPLDRYVGNRCLTWAQNRLAGVRFAEWHSGFRAYRLAPIHRIPLERLPDGFEFDVAMTLALLDAGARVEEVSCSTRYADEVSRVQVVPYGLRVLRLAAIHRYRRSGRSC